MPRAKTQWTSKIDKLLTRIEGDAMRSGLKAGGVVVQEVIQDRLAEGYTSGDFVTGVVAKDVKRSRPSRSAVFVYTANPVALAWELGHLNVYTKQYERVEVWRPALEENIEKVRAAFAARFLEKLGELAHRRLLPALGSS